MLISFGTGARWCGATGLRLLILVVALGWAVPARAQIYSWRDANGNLVVSNRRPAQGATAKSFAVPEAQTVRATRYAAADRGLAYDDLIRENAHEQGVRVDLVRAVDRQVQMRDRVCAVERHDGDPE